MREIVLDTETTGLDFNNGDRIVEIGIIELVNHVQTGNYFHYYLNPEKESDFQALKIHGLTSEFLKGKPKFDEIVDKAFFQYHLRRNTQVSLGRIRNILHKFSLFLHYFLRF